MLKITKGFMPEDIEPLHQLEKRCFKEAFRWRKEDLIEALETTDIWIGVYEGKIVGCVLVELEKESTGHIVSLCVDPAYQKQGFGRLLMEEVESSLQTAGIKTIRLEVQVDNPAQVLYFKLGYRVTGVKPRYYSNGTMGVSMAKTLKKGKPNSPHSAFSPAEPA